MLELLSHVMQCIYMLLQASVLTVHAMQQLTHAIASLCSSVDKAVNRYSGRLVLSTADAVLF